MLVVVRPPSVENPSNSKRYEVVPNMIELFKPLEDTDTVRVENRICVGGHHQAQERYDRHDYR